MKPKNRINILPGKSSGFTLIEVAIAVSIASLIIIISYNWIVMSNKTFGKEQSMISIRNDIRILTDAIKNDIQNSEDVNDVSPYEFQKYKDSKDIVSIVKYYYDPAKKSVVREINEKKDIYLKGIVSGFDISSDDLKKFNVDIKIVDKEIKNIDYRFLVSMRNNNADYGDNSGGGSGDYTPDVHGNYLMTLVMGSEPAGGVVVTPHENIKPLFHEGDYKDGFDIIIEDMPGNSKDFRITIFGHTLTYGEDDLSYNHKIFGIFIENLDSFNRQITVYNYSSLHFNIGFDSNKHNEIPAGNTEVYKSGNWKKF